MNVNYNINHELLQHEALRDLKNKELLVVWLVWSQIMHMTWHQKKPWAFRQGDFCLDLKISQSTCSSALKYLISKDLIKCIKPYSKIGNQPGIYAVTGASIRFQRNQYQKHSKPVSPSDRVNNVNNIIRDDDVKTSPPNKNKVTFPSQSSKEPNWNLNKTNK